MEHLNRSRSQGNSTCLNSMPKTISMQGLQLAAKLLQENEIFNVDVCQNHWSVKSRSRSLSQSVSSKTMLRPISMQGLKLTNIIAREKCTIQMESEK